MRLSSELVGYTRVYFRSECQGKDWEKKKLDQREQANDNHEFSGGAQGIRGALALIHNRPVGAFKQGYM